MFSKKWNWKWFGSHEFHGFIEVLPKNSHRPGHFHLIRAVRFLFQKFGHGLHPVPAETGGAFGALRP